MTETQEIGADAPASPAQKRVAFGQSQASVLLDLIRGLAAILVLIGHWRNLLFVDYPDVRTHRLLFAPVYVLTDAGHQAVVIFFVLSGYLIGGSIYRAFQQDRWSWTSYMTHRVVRLWVVLLPGLVLCGVFDALGLWSHRAPLTYAGLGPARIVGDVHANLTAHGFLGNLFFLQAIRVPVFGSDGALWSLANEFWYYVLFPLGLLALWPGPAVRRIVCVTGFAAATWFIGPWLTNGFPIWLAGALLAVMPSLKAGAVLRSVAATIYVPVLFFLSKYRGMTGLMSDYLLGAATFLLLWVLLSAKRSADEASGGVKVSRLLARCSFTLYVVHTPLLVLLTAMLAGDTRWTPDARHLSEGMAMLAVVMGFTYAVAWLTEFRTDKLRRLVEPRVQAIAAWVQS